MKSRRWRGLPNTIPVFKSADTIPMSDIQRLTLEDDEGNAYAIFF
jgi:hypothetical protein